MYISNDDYIVIVAITTFLDEYKLHQIFLKWILLLRHNIL
jgi:hypothetical protein